MQSFSVQTTFRLQNVTIAASLACSQSQVSAHHVSDQRSTDESVYVLSIHRHINVPMHDTHKLGKFVESVPNVACIPCVFRQNQLLVVIKKTTSSSM